MRFNSQINIFIDVHLLFYLNNLNENKCLIHNDIFKLYMTISNFLFSNKLNLDCTSRLPQKSQISSYQMLYVYLHLI